MKKVIIIGLLTILLLALIVGFKAFLFVFGTIMHYGLFALCIAILIYLGYRFTSKKDDEPK